MAFRVLFVKNKNERLENTINNGNIMQAREYTVAVVYDNVERTSFLT